MFINNTTGKAIKDISFEGYSFTIPAGISLVWDVFGKWVVEHYSVKKGEETNTIPPVILAKPSQWKGQLRVEVVRFPLNGALIPKRDDLLKIAKTRGIDAETIEMWREDATIDNKEIAKTINDLDVPEHIKFPTVGEETQEDTTAEDAAEAALKNAPASPETAPGATKQPETAPTAPAPKTASKKANGGKPATPKTPRTPKTPKK